MQYAQVMVIYVHNYFKIVAPTVATSKLCLYTSWLALIEFI